MDGDKAEHIVEAAGVLSSYADAIGMRAFSSMDDFDSDMADAAIFGLADHASVPVISLESAGYHPCQGLADALTMRDLLGQPKGKKLVFTWAPHPKQLPMAVPNSGIWAGAALGMDVVLTHPEGFELDALALQEAETLASASVSAS